MPAIVDHDPAHGGAPISVFESGAILLHLAEKCGRFVLYAKDKLEYAIERYRRESERLYGVLDRRLEARDHICVDYSIADIACWPWVVTNKAQNIDLGAFPNVRRWYDALTQRPALRRGYVLGRELRGSCPVPGIRLQKRAREAKI